MKLPWLSVSILLSPTEDPTVASSFRISMHQEHLISGPGQHSVGPASVITDVVVWTQKMQPSIQSMSGHRKCSPPSSQCLDTENAALHPVNVWTQKMQPSIQSLSGCRKCSSPSCQMYGCWKYCLPSGQCLDAENAAFHLVNVWIQSSIWSWVTASVAHQHLFPLWFIEHGQVFVPPLQHLCPHTHTM